jgi:predicted MFS family arabinose efflux permease
MPPMLFAISRSIDAPIEEVIQAMSLYFLAYGLMQPLWGTVSDRIGRVNTMRLAMLLAGICTLGSTLATSVLWLAVMRGLAGTFFGAAYPTCLVYLGDSVPPRLRQGAVAKLMVGTAGGTAVASLGAGALADAVAWQLPFALTGLMAFGVSVLLGRLPEPGRATADRSVWRPLVHISRSRATQLVLALAFLEGGILIGMLTLLPPAVEAAGASTTLSGLTASVFGFAVYLSSLVVGPLSQRTHPARLVAFGGTCASLACILLAASRTPLAAVVVATLLGLAWTSMHSSLQTWATEVLPEARATVVSLFASALFVGSAVAAALVGGLADAGRYSEIFVYGALVCVPFTVVATWSRRRWRQAPVIGPDGGAAAGSGVSMISMPCGRFLRYWRFNTSKRL